MTVVILMILDVLYYVKFYISELFFHHPNKNHLIDPPVIAEVQVLEADVADCEKKCKQSIVVLSMMQL